VRARREKSESDELRVVVPLQAALLDPTQGSVQALGVMLLGLEPPVRLQDDGSLAPQLATKMEQPDDKTYVYELLGGVQFWDGSPLTKPSSIAHSSGVPFGDAERESSYFSSCIGLSGSIQLSHAFVSDARHVEPPPPGLRPA
jgi:peptide/nickel transport system substrate-binding protein